MNLFSFITLVIAALMGVSSTMLAPVARNTILSIGNATVTHLNTTERIPTRNKPYCNPTGTGICNFAFVNVVNALGDSPSEAYVYDNTCSEIGENFKMPYGDFSIFSQLKYAVVGNSITQKFCYAGLCYDKNCITYYGNDAGSAIVKQCAFDCY